MCELSLEIRDDVNIDYEKYQPENLPAMPIFPLEIFKLTDRDSVDCIDPDCKNCKSSDSFVIIDKVEDELYDLMGTNKKEDKQE